MEINTTINMTYTIIQTNTRTLLRTKNEFIYYFQKYGEGREQIDSSTIDGKVVFVHSLSTAVFLRHKCQLSFCVRQNYK